MKARPASQEARVVAVLKIALNCYSPNTKRPESRNLSKHGSHCIPWAQRRSAIPAVGSHPEPAQPSNMAYLFYNLTPVRKWPQNSIS